MARGACQRCFTLPRRLVCVRRTICTPARLGCDNTPEGDVDARPAGRRLFLDSVNPVALSGASHDKQRSEEHTSELQSLMRISYAVFCLKKKNKKIQRKKYNTIINTSTE